jgi:hypothetical protein
VTIGGRFWVTPEVYGLSGWNPNVALELGLAHGLHRKPYFILVNTRLSSEVPSDIKGIQRIQYSHLTIGKSSLRRQLAETFFRAKFQPAKGFWQGLAGHAERELRCIFGLHLLGYLRENPEISNETCRTLANKLGLRRGVWQEVCDTLWNQALLAKVRGGGYRLLKRRRVFKEEPW